MSSLRDEWSSSGPRKDEPVLSIEELAPSVTADFQNRLRVYREQYERLYGPTPCRVYTSMLPERIQDWMMADEDRRLEYFRGLPPFMISYFEELGRNMSREGRLDDLADPVVAAFIQARGYLSADFA
jgi:hypothetical protein